MGPESTKRLATGSAGLDAILDGGLPADRSYLIQGIPGTGKTTLALRFLLEGLRLGERGLYISLSETRAELEDVAASHGWSLADLAMVDLSVVGDLLEPQAQTTMFHPAEIDLNRTMDRIMAEVEKVKPERIAFDSLAEVRFLAQEPLRFRRQLLAMKQNLLRRGATVLFLDDHSAADSDQQVQSIVHGVITLERSANGYGNMRRRLIVDKLRGVAFNTGYHDFLIQRGGCLIFPRLEASVRYTKPDPERMVSGVAELDIMLGGGLDRGSNLLLLGPAGCGKSSLATCFLAAAARRREKSVVWAFEETRNIFLDRAKGLGMDLQPFIDQKLITAHQVDPANITPGELAQRVRDDVEGHGARLVVIDSLTGYLNAMPSEEHLHLHLHELLAYLNQHGVVTIMTLAQHGMFGAMRSTDISYIADSVVMLRFFEAFGAVKKAISVVKKRTGGHEDTIREFSLVGGKVRVGAALSTFQGVLSGTPRFHGKTEDILGKPQ